MNLFFSIFLIDHECGSDVESYSNNVLVDGRQGKVKLTVGMAVQTTIMARHDRIVFVVIELTFLTFILLFIFASLYLLNLFLTSFYCVVLCICLCLCHCMI